MKDIRRVKKISLADKELLAELKRIVLGFVPDATLVVYGSTARGERTAESDYDVLVLTDHQLSTKGEDEIRGTVYELQLEREVVISLFFYSEEQWRSPFNAATPFYRNVEREAVAL